MNKVQKFTKKLKKKKEKSISFILKPSKSKKHAV